jgi:hypothetical protein
VLPDPVPRVFLASAGQPRAEGATRVPPAALGQVLGLDRAPEVKTIRRKLAELAAAGKAADLAMALARRHAAARPEAPGFLYVDGHARVYYGTRDVRTIHVARPKFPAPATMETWVTDQQGDRVFMVVAGPSDSLAGELRRLLTGLRQVAGEGRRVTVCFDRAAGPRPCSPISPRPGSTCSPGARARPRPARRPVHHHHVRR